VFLVVNKHYQYAKTELFIKGPKPPKTPRKSNLL
jgi:hypothetical protein